MLSRIVVNSLKLNNSRLRLISGVKNFTTSIKSESLPSTNDLKPDSFESTQKIKYKPTPFILEKEILDNKIRDIQQAASIEEKRAHIKKLLVKAESFEHYQNHSRYTDFIRILVQDNQVEVAKSLLAKITDNLIKVDQGRAYRFVNEALYTILIDLSGKSQFEEINEYLIQNGTKFISFYESRYFKQFLTDLSKSSYKKFNDLVYNLYTNNFITSRSSVNLLLMALEMNEEVVYRNFYQYHFNSWGPLNIGQFSDILSTLLIKKSTKFMLDLIDDMLVKGEFQGFNEKYIHQMIRLVYREYKDDPAQLKVSIYKILAIAHHLDRDPISRLLFFYSTFYDNPDYFKEERINKITLSTINHVFLFSLRDGSKASTIQKVIELLLASDQYHKALYWYFNFKEIVQEDPKVVGSFIAYHSVHLEESKDFHLQCIEFWNSIDRNAKRLISKESGFLSLFNQNRAQYAQYLDFSLGSQNYSKTIEFSVKKTTEQLFSVDKELLRLLNGNAPAYDIYTYLEDNYLKFNTIPKGTLLIKAILAIKQDPNIYSKLENFHHPMISGSLFKCKADISLKELTKFYEDGVIKQFIDSESTPSESDQITKFTSLLSSMFYYNFNINMAFNGLANLIERKIPISFSLLEQAVNVILKNKTSLDREVIKMPVIYSYIKKFIKKNPTYEDGYLLAIRVAVESRNFEEANDYFNNELFKSNRNTRALLTHQAKVVLERNSNPKTLVEEVISFIDRVVKDPDCNYSFIINPIFKNLVGRLKMRQLEQFEKYFLSNTALVNSLDSLDNETIAHLILFYSMEGRKVSYLDLFIKINLISLITKDLKRISKPTYNDILGILNKYRLKGLPSSNPLFESFQKSPDIFN